MSLTIKTNVGNDAVLSAIARFTNQGAKSERIADVATEYEHGGSFLDLQQLHCLLLIFSLYRGVDTGSRDASVPAAEAGRI